MSLKPTIRLVPAASFDVPLEYSPLVEAGIKLGDWLCARPEATKRQRQDIERTQASLRAVPAVPGKVYEASYWAILEHYDRKGNITGERWAWTAHINAEELGVSSYFSNEGEKARGIYDDVGEMAREVWWSIGGRYPETPTEQGRKRLLRQLQRLDAAFAAPGARLEIRTDYRLQLPPVATRRPSRKKAPRSN